MKLIKFGGSYTVEFDVISLLSSPVVSVSGGTLSAVATTFLTDYYYKDKLQVKQLINDLVKSKFENPDLPFSAVEVVKCRNILRIAEIADRLHSTHSVEECEFSLEWFYRFFEAASMVSDEDMQAIWAKILRSESDSSGDFSFRLIETLKLMNKYEAELFLKVARLSIQDFSGGLYIYAIENEAIMELYERFGISESDLLILEECGLIKMALLATHEMDLSVESPHGFYNEHAYINFQMNEEKEISMFEFTSYAFTRIGQQLYWLIEEKTNKEFLLALARELKKQVEGKINISAHEIHFNDDDSITYNKYMDLLKKSPKNRTLRLTRYR